MADGLDIATARAPRRPANWDWVVTRLEDTDHDGTFGDQLHDYVRANISGMRMALAIPVLPHERDGRFHLSSWPQPVEFAGPLDCRVWLARPLRRDGLLAAVLHRLVGGRGRLDRSLLGPDETHRRHDPRPHPAVRVVTRDGRMAATFVALCVMGVAGCTSATPSPTAVTVETPAATAALAIGIAIPDRHSRPRCRDGGRAARPGAHRLDLRVRQRWRVDPLLVGLRGRCGTRRLPGPLALPGPRGRPARGPVAQPGPGSRHREDRRRPRNGGIRRHSAGRRARMEALAHPTARGRRDPARLTPRRCGRLGVRPELQHPGVDDRLDGLRSRSRRSGVSAALGARSGLGAGRAARARRRRGRAVVPIALREPRRLLRGRLLGRSDDRHAHRLCPRARRARRGARNR